MRRDSNLFPGNVRNREETMQIRPTKIILPYATNSHKTQIK
jgi:hypothetical protein